MISKKLFQSFLEMRLQPATAQSFGGFAAKIHVCGLISIFCPAHVAAKNDSDFFAPKGANGSRLLAVKNAPYGFAIRSILCYMEMVVPVLPAMPSRAFSRSVMSATRPGLDSANFTAASTLGSIEPGANCLSAM